MGVRLPGEPQLARECSWTSPRANASRGLFRCADGALTRVTEQPRRVHGWGYLYTDRRGRIWKGQSDRVVLYDHGSVRDFGAGDKVPPGLVFTIYEDRAASVRVGGKGG
jgi:hypothetical protein